MSEFQSKPLDNPTSDAAMLIIRCEDDEYTCARFQNRCTCTTSHRDTNCAVRVVDHSKWSNIVFRQAHALQPISQRAFWAVRHSSSSAKAHNKPRKLPHEMNLWTNQTVMHRAHSMKSGLTTYLSLPKKRPDFPSRLVTQNHGHPKDLALKLPSSYVGLISV